MLRLIVWLSFSAIVQGCGISVHLSIVHRLLPLLPSRLAQHAKSVRAGAFYPDAFYDCMGQSETAEDAHWPPFLAAGAAIVRERAAKGLDTAKLEAFLIGVLSHQVSDISWHSLGVHQGLLRAMADREFDGDYDTAHSVLDIGGDMIQVNRLQASGANNDWLYQEWDYDNADIIEILSRMNRKVNGAQINYCMTRGRAALTAEQKVASSGYRRYARQSPLLYNELEEYFIGGISDMTERTAECLDPLLSWFSNPSDNAWDLCQVFEGRKPPNTSQTDENALNMHVMHHLVYESSSIFSLKGFKELASDALSGMTPFSISQKKPLAREIPAKNLSIGRMPYSKFGSHIRVWGPDHWAVAAPGEGTVHIYNQSFHLNNSIVGPANESGAYHPQFGAAMETYRMSSKNSRQETLLLVASPGLSRIDGYALNGSWHGSLHFPHAVSKYGSVGPKIIGKQLRFDPIVRNLYIGAPAYDVIDRHQEIEQAGAVFAIPESMLEEAFDKVQEVKFTHENIVIQGQKPYDRVGSRLALNARFVLVGSPGESKVYGLDRLTHRVLLTLENDANTGFGDFLLDGVDDYIVIGAPLTDSETQKGRIYVYKNNQRHTYELYNADFAAQLGYEGVLEGSRYIYTTSPHAYTEQGAVWRIDLHTNSITELASGPSHRSSAFGQSIALNDTTLCIGLPFYEERGAITSINVESH